MKTALVVGSTGLTGKNLVDILLESNQYKKIVLLTRKKTDDFEQPQIEQVITDFDRLEAFSEKVLADDIYCCLGTTMKKAGSKEAFFKVDYEYPLKTASIALRQGAQQFLLMSSLGANKNSSIYYNSVKGKIEEAICQLGYPSVSIFRPSLLLGDRNETRIGEGLAQFFTKIFFFLFIGPFKKYKPVKARQVARAMASIARLGKPGTVIYESQQIQET